MRRELLDVQLCAPRRPARSPRFRRFEQLLFILVAAAAWPRSSASLFAVVIFAFEFTICLVRSFVEQLFAGFAAFVAPALASSLCARLRSFLFTRSLR